MKTDLPPVVCEVRMDEQAMVLSKTIIRWIERNFTGHRAVVHAPGMILTSVPPLVLHARAKIKEAGWLTFGVSIHRFSEDVHCK